MTRRTVFKTELKPIEVSLKNFTTRADADASYSFRVTSEVAENFTGAGTVSNNPIRSSGELQITAVDVKKYLPYAEDFFRGKLVGGKLATRVPYRVALEAGKRDMLDSRDTRHLSKNPLLFALICMIG